MTIPLGFVAEKYGQRTVLWMNLIPRVFMLAWTVVVGYFEHAFPPRAIIAGPFLSALGGDCVFNSMTYALAASITDDYVLRYAIHFFLFLIFFFSVYHQGQGSICKLNFLPVPPILDG